MRRASNATVNTQQIRREGEPARLANCGFRTISGKPDIKADV
jgi:hypothetical protein